MAFVYILFAIIYTTCGGMSDDGDAIIDSSGRSYEMSNQTGGGTRRRRRRRQMGPNSVDKQEPLVGVGIHPTGGITDNEGFITDCMNSTSSDGSSGRLRLS